MSRYPGPWKAVGSVDGFAKRCGLYRPSDHASQRDDGQDVRDHLNELRRHELQRLQTDLHRLRSREKETRNINTFGVPLAEDDGSERDEATPGRHSVGELVLVERQVRAAQRGR